MYIDNILFAIILILGIGFFAKNVKKLKRNINLGHDVNRNDNPSARWANMAMIAKSMLSIYIMATSYFFIIVSFTGALYGLFFFPKRDTIT